MHLHHIGEVNIYIYIIHLCICGCQGLNLGPSHRPTSSATFLLFFLKQHLAELLNCLGGAQTYNSASAPKMLALQASATVPSSVHF